MTATHRKMRDPNQHDCPGGCGNRVPHHLFACRRCWGRLPTSLRVPINETHLRAVVGHRQAMANALEWYRKHPVRDTGGLG
jgi:hypothetical protein